MVNFLSLEGRGLRPALSEANVMRVKSPLSFPPRYNRGKLRRDSGLVNSLPLCPRLGSGKGKGTKS